ncbi:MAG: ParB N-terminal domain-containing protein [Bdellovibrionales bacterium]|nr:ParB N-terminal domain-containing protein [Bdellovibrionales bacterium]
MEAKLRLSQVEVDDLSLPREEYKKEEIEHYAECLKNGDILPPIVVFKKDSRFILASGHLRFEAHKLIEAIEIDVIVKEGSDHERIIESIESNSKHGLRLTNEEKRKCIKYFLSHPETRNWGDVSFLVENREPLS